MANNKAKSKAKSNPQPKTDAKPKPMPPPILVPNMIYKVTDKKGSSWMVNRVIGLIYINEIAKEDYKGLLEKVERIV